MSRARRRARRPREEGAVGRIVEAGLAVCDDIDQEIDRSLERHRRRRGTPRPQGTDTTKIVIIVLLVLGALFVAQLALGTAALTARTAIHAGHRASYEAERARLEREQMRLAQERARLQAAAAAQRQPASSQPSRPSTSDRSKALEDEHRRRWDAAGVATAQALDRLRASMRALDDAMDQHEVVDDQGLDLYAKAEALHRQVRKELQQNRTNRRRYYRDMTGPDLPRYEAWAGRLDAIGMQIDGRTAAIKN